MTAPDATVAPARVDLRFLPADTRVRVPPGVTLFDAASWNGIAIDSTCGGHGTCKKCRIRFKADPPVPTSLDLRAYTTAEIKDGWRLACRTTAVTDADVEVPPLVTRPKAATVGVGRQVILRPAVSKRYLELAEPSLADQVTANHTACLANGKLSSSYCDAAYRSRDGSPNCTLPVKISTGLDGDLTADFGGVTLTVDRMSAPYVQGASIDFVDTIEKQGFTIDNPNATGSCACGDSFH